MLTLNLNRLKAERVAQGYTQESLAATMGKKRNWYAKRENGICDFGVDDFTKIVDKLGFSKNDISIFFENSVPERER